MSTEKQKPQEQQYEFEVKELSVWIDKQKLDDSRTLMLHSSGDGKIKVNEVSDVLICDGIVDSIDYLKKGRLAVGTFYIRSGCLTRQKKKWVSPVATA